MNQDFVVHFSSTQELSPKLVELIGTVLDYFENSTQQFDEELKSIINDWEYQKVIDTYGFKDSFPILRFVSTYTNGLSLVSLMDFDNSTDVSDFHFSSYPNFNIRQFELNNDDEYSFFFSFNHRLQMAWCAYKWQEFNGNSIGYAAHIMVNSAMEIFFLTDLKVEGESQYGEPIEYKNIKDVQNPKLTLLEIYQRLELYISG